MMVDQETVSRPVKAASQMKVSHGSAVENDSADTEDEDACISDASDGPPAEVVVDDDKIESC